MKFKKLICCMALCAAIVLPLVLTTACGGECDHSWSEWTVSTAATCTTAGQRSRTCSKCDDTDTDTVAALGHAYGDWIVTTAATCTAAGERTKTCANNSSHTEKEAVAALGHTFTTYVSDKNATCAADGTKTADCDNAGCTVTDTVASAGTKLTHKFTTYKSDDNATCAKDGTKTATCDHADCAVTDTVADTGTKLAHKFTTYTSDNNATCLEDGTKTATCDNKDCMVTDTVADAGTKLTHSFTDYDSNEDAACEEDGTKTATCDHGCGETDTVNDEGSALEHLFTEYFPDGNATCEVDGTKTATCDHGCGETDTVDDEGSALGHEFTNYDSNEDATCAKDGTKTATCDNPGCLEEDTVDDEGSASGHSFTEYFSDENATCDEDGTKTAACDNGSCSETDTVADPGSKLEHKYTTYVSNNDATCGETGTKTAACDHGCGEEHTMIDIGSKLEHDYGDWTVDTAATCTTVGNRTRVCANDDSHIDEEEIPASGHSFTNYNSDDNATCEADGTKTATCDNGCGDTDTIADPGSMSGHDYDEDITTPATCAGKGSATYTCKNADCGDTYTDEIPVLGHNWDIDAPTCEDDQTCLRDDCGEVNPAIGHNYALVGHTDVGCENDGVDHYECENCGDENDDITDLMTGHDKDTVYSLKSETLKDGETCVYVQVYSGTCSDCGETVTKTEEATKHSLSASITTPATCQTDGVKTYSCTTEGCTHSETKDYSDTNAHVWNSGNTADGLTTYTCTVEGCDKEKTTIAAGGESTQTSKDNLSKVDEVELDAASIALDKDTLDGIEGDDVKLSAGTLDGNDLEEAKSGLTDEQKEQIGDNPIYNFTMDVDGNPVTTFGGKVTVRIPYTLAAGEDPECIAIWYIDAEGNVTSIKAEYVNGYAVFETDHFSYYTVTKLSATERCELYSHNYQSTKKDPTCVAEGYTRYVCQRCGHSYIGDKVKATGHDMAVDKTKTLNETCTTNGSIVYTCDNKCGYTYTTVIPATGHSHKATEDKVDATCTAPGYTVYACENTDCTHSYKTTIGQLEHDFDVVVTAPTCTTGGYTTHTCPDCGFTKKTDAEKATGHNYTITVIPASCTTDGYTHYECGNCGDEFDINVVKAAHKWNMDAPTCGKGQVCLLCEEEGAKATGAHEMVLGVCVLCGEGCEHNYRDTVVPPSCLYSGYTRYDCTICGYMYKAGYTEPVGHKGGMKCESCGEQHFEDDLFTNFLSSLMSGNYAIKLYNFELYLDDDIIVDFAELHLALDENGKLTGYGSFNFTQGRMSMSGQGVIENGNLYLNGKGNMGQHSTKLYDYYYIIPLESVLDANMLVGFENIIAALDWAASDLVPILESVLDLGAKEINDVIANFIVEFISYEVGEDKYTFTLDGDAIRSFAHKLQTMTIGGLYERLTGQTADELLDRLNEMLDMTPSELKEIFAEKGLDLENALAKANELMSRFDPDYNLDYFIGGATGNYDISISDIINGISGEDKTLREILNELMADEEFSGWLIDFIKDHTTRTIYNVVSEHTGMTEDEVVEFIDGILSGISGGITVAMTKSGELIYVAADVTYDGLFVCEAEVIKDYTPTTNYDDVKNGANAGKELATTDIIVEYLRNLGYTVTVDEDGTIWFEMYNEKDDMTGSGSDKDYYYEDWQLIESTISGYILADMIRSGADCTDITELMMYARISQTEYIKDYKKYFDLDTKELIRTEQQKEHNSGYSGMNELKLYYDKQAKKVVNASSAHYYMLDTEAGFPPKDCKTEGEKHYSCVRCGDSYIEYYWAEHEYVTEYELEGDTCEDGVQEYYRCRICGDGHGGGWYSWHGINVRNDIDLSGYDACEHHEIYFESCVCGEQSYFHHDLMPHPEDKGYMCFMCDLRYVETETVYSEGCEETVTTAYELSFNGTLIYSDVAQLKRTSHKNLVTYVTLADGSKNCDDGVIVRNVCSCGYEGDPYPARHHAYGVIEIIDLKDHGANGGVIYVNGCACGDSVRNVSVDDRKDYETDHIFVDDKQITIYTRRADGFAFALIDETEVIDCVAYTKRYVYFNYDLVEDTYSERYCYGEDSRESHGNIRSTSKLAAGSKDCADGTIVTNSCVDCGEVTYTYNSSGHNSHYIAEYAFTDYGSTCEGAFEKHGCACGEVISYQFRMIDFDQDYKGDNTWWYICPVTDPKCNFVIEKTYEVYADNPHEAYQVYHLGSLDSKGEKVVCAEGGRFANYTDTKYIHSYVDSTVHSTEGEGYTESRWLCSVCGDGWIELYDDKGERIRRTEINVYPNQKTTSIYEYYNGGYQYIISQFSEYKNGSWDRSEYTYDFTGEVCSRTVVYTGSNGYNDTRTEEACHNRQYGDTCTQKGINECVVCHDFKNYTWVNRHNWFGSVEEGYRCSRCGLENANGASGKIIFEDLSGQHGYDINNYYVGYYNEHNYDYTAYVSVVLHEEDDKGNSIYQVGNLGEINDIASDDGESVITIYRSALAAWAAENGITGEYDVRLTFVPDGPEDNCDYAITLTRPDFDVITAYFTGLGYTATVDEYGKISISGTEAESNLQSEGFEGEDYYYFYNDKEYSFTGYIEYKDIKSTLACTGIAGIALYAHREGTVTYTSYKVQVDPITREELGGRESVIVDDPINSDESRHYNIYYNADTKALIDNAGHDHAMRYELAGESCVDGVIEYEYCTKCNISRANGQANRHEFFTNKDTSLSEYGSACGGTLTQSVCTCGEVVWYTMFTNCNFSYAQDGEHSMVMTCQNDGCSFAYKQTHEIIDEGSCIAYMVHYVGYDSESGKYDLGIVYKDQYTHFHTNEETSGESEEYSGCTESLSTCTVCGSYERYIYDVEGKHYKSFIRTVHDNLTTIQECSYRDGIQYEDMQRTEYFDGRWEESLYTYDFDTRIKTIYHTSSSGDPHSYTEGF